MQSCNIYFKPCLGQPHDKKQGYRKVCFPETSVSTTWCQPREPQHKKSRPINYKTNNITANDLKYGYFSDTAHIMWEITKCLYLIITAYEAYYVQNVTKLCKPFILFLFLFFQKIKNVIKNV